MLANFIATQSGPVLVTGIGATFETIKGQRASLEYDDLGKSGQVNLIVGSKILVTLEGHSVSREELVVYARAAG